MEQKEMIDLLRQVASGTMDVEQAALKLKEEPLENFDFAKIEGKSRKTDPWMALAASMVVEPVLGNGMAAEIPPVGAIRL